MSESLVYRIFRDPTRSTLWAILIAVAVTVCMGCFRSEPEAEAGPSGNQRMDHALWDSLLQSHVNSRGRVDYAKMRQDARLPQYLELLKTTNAARLANADEQLAFWINAYNALTIRAVIDTLPADQGKWPDYKIIDQKIDGKSIWKGRSFDVGGERRTLDEIEHEIIRKRDGLRDPRIHVALVCAARGCPNLWNHAYTGDKVRDQLADAMRRFVNDSDQIKWNGAKKTLTASKILEWYGGDFASEAFLPHSESIGQFLADYANDKSMAAALRAFKGKIQYIEYDWRLNLKA